MIILSKQDVRQALPMEQAIEAMKRAYASLSDGRAEVPLRTRLPVSPQDAVSLIMPAFVQDEQGSALAVKVVSVFPHNPGRGLPLIYAAVLVLEADTGRPLALMEGGSLTAIRTGAASGAATDLLARPDCQVAAIFGAGVQGRTQLAAVCTVRPIRTVWIYDPDLKQAQAFIAETSGRGRVPSDLRPAPTPQHAVAEADIICCATTSSTPVFSDSDLKPGVHINGVGSYTPAMQEIPGETVARARLVVDSRQACLAETGDLILPIQQGLCSEQHIHAELGEIILGHKPGREDPSQVTVFKSVGIAVQDAAAAQLALRNAVEHGLGQQVNW
jgi:ornithine cyclodeaminase